MTMCPVTADGLTRNEFLAQIGPDCSNVEYLDFGIWHQFESTTPITYANMIHDLDRISTCSDTLLQYYRISRICHKNMD